ncbi:MAG: GNAT family N-acetyltransferase [Neisseria sp.]|nr:GNAT family N-acetyltransferase [Neisseria sp.]
MSEQFLNDIIIQGITNKGKIFRPSDWSERLSGILSSFDQDHRLAYHSYVRPLLINQVRCVVVDKNLEQLNPAMFRFLTDFAGDNDLRVCDGSEAAGISTQVPQPAPAPEAEAPQPYRIVEIPPHETAHAFPAMLVLRPHLTSAAQFVGEVNNVLRDEGYRLVGIFEEGRTQALAVCGFRVSHNLAWGKHLSIDDLSTLPEHRGHGFAKQLLDFIHEEAERLGRLPVHVDSAVGIERQEAHRLYFNSGYRISSYHFMRGK